MSELWLSHCSAESPQLLKNSIDRRIKDIAFQEWHSEIDTNSQCTNYKLFKKEMKFENYLTTLGYQDRLALTRFRLRNSKIPSNVLASNAYNSTVCFLCDTGDIGDEFHYLLVCDAFKEHRRKFIKPYYYSRPNIIKFEALFNLKAGKKQKNLIKYIQFVSNCFNV